MLKIKTLEVDSSIERLDLKKLKNAFPFNDEYYEFDTECLSEKFTLGNFVNGFLVKI